MSYCLRKMPLHREVRRVARLQFEGALKQVLMIPEQDPGTAVHEARKHIKKTRALLRLVRGALPDRFWKRENAALRNAAKRMAPIRDAHVREQTMAKLLGRPATHRATLKRIHQGIATHLQKVLAAAQEDDWSKLVASDLERLICRLGDWPLKAVDAKSIRKALEAAWKKARHALATGSREPSDANLHEFRTRLKDLWHDLQLLSADCPPRTRTLTKRLRNLTDKLGYDHDLAMLLAARDDLPQLAAADWDTLERVVRPRRLRAQRAALRLAKTVLKPKADTFAKFVFDRWQKWRSRR